MAPTPNELSVLHRLAEPGASYASVAHDLGITENAARQRMWRLYRRLGVHSDLQAWAALGLRKDRAA